ncbi:LPD38 domain-containing protein [Paenibacillus sp. FSL M7-0547]|uniref:LPD38 domain-containing protein n=1 Tax=Paenibacillus sp. FSL M7-0547 TaxID=2954755 RepID=UPI0030F9C043
MATRYEQFVESQRKRAEDIRQQALNGTLKPASSSSASSRSERFRQRQSELATETDPLAPIRKELLDTTLGSVGIGQQPKVDMSPKPVSTPLVQPKMVDFKQDQANQRAAAAQTPSPFESKTLAPVTGNLNSSIQSTLQGKLPAASLLQQTGGGPANASQLPGATEYDIREKRIDDTRIPEVLKLPSRALNKLAFDTPLGLAVSRSLAGNSGVTQRDSTGNKVVDKITDLVNDFITPMLTPTGAPVGTGPNVGTYEVAGKALSKGPGQAAVNKIAQGISKIAPKVSPETAQTIARQGLTETIAGPLQGVGIGLANQQDSNEQIRGNALYGAAGGALLGFGGAAAGAGLRNLFRANGIPESEAAELLALPEGRGTIRQKAAAERSTLAAGTDPVVNPYAYELPEASVGTRAAVDNVANGRSGLREIDQSIHELQTSYEQAVIDEYKLLKEQLSNRGGVEQGSIYRSPDGEVVGRTGRQSNNPRWYQEFYAANGKRPSNKELYALARERVENGFIDDAGRFPSWKEQNGYDEKLAGLTQARETLAGSVKELDPALRVTNSPLVASELKDLRQTGPSQVKKPIEESVSPVSEPEVQLTAREQEINSKPLSALTQDDIDYLLERSKEREFTTPSVEESSQSVRPSGAWQRLLQETTDQTPSKLDLLPSSEPILRPNQFDEQSGLGIAAGQRVSPYDSLKTDTRSQLVSRQKKETPSITGLRDRAYTALVDDLHGLNKQDKLLEEIMGEKLPSNQRIHDLGLASRGADVVSKRIITDDLVDSQGQVVGESLKSILAPMKSLMKRNKHIYVDFEDYLLNKHAVTRFDRGEKVFRDDLGWTPEFGTQKAAEYEEMFPQFKEMADNLYAFQNQMVQSWLVDTGMISQDVANAWFEANPYYVPNKRYFSELEKTGKSKGGKSKQGYGNQSVPVKGYQTGGSQRLIISPIEAMIENVDGFVKSAKRNQVMQQYVRNIKRAPEDFADWAEVVKQPEKPEDIAKIALEDGGLEEVLFRFSADFDKAMQRTQLDKDNVVRALIDGDPVHVKIKDKQLLSALTALGPEQSGVVLRWIGKLTNTMKLLTTGNNPVFSLTRNLFRDIPQAYIASTTSDNPIAFASDLISSAIDIGLRRRAYKDFLNVGGGHASAIASDRDLLRQSKNAVLPQSGFTRAHRTLRDGYENFLNAVEIAPRLSEFKRIQAQGGDLHAALMAAQDLTVNFKRRGALSGEVDKIFPYFNATMQGLDKTVRTYKDNPTKAIMKSVLAVTLPTMALYALNYDDPEYKKLSNRTKDAFLMIPRGDGTFIKIAKPQEQGSIFSDIPERLMRLFAEEDPAAFRDFADRMRTTFIPPGIQGMTGKRGVIGGLLGDTILGPGVDVVANESWSGAQVVPAYLDNLSPGLQADAKTTNIARKIGELTYGTPIEQSPKKLDYLARQYTGWLGQFGQPLLTSGGDAGYALEQQMVADPVFSNDLSSEFYHYKDKLDQANNDSNLKDLPDWYSDGLRKKLAKISKNMSKIRADMRDVQNDKSLSNKAKRDELRKLQQSINDMAERGNDLARDTVPY